MEYPLRGTESSPCGEGDRICALASGRHWSGEARRSGDRRPFGGLMKGCDGHNINKPSRVKGLALIRTPRLGATPLPRCSFPALGSQAVAVREQPALRTIQDEGRSALTAPIGPFVEVGFFPSCPPTAARECRFSGSSLCPPACCSGRWASRRRSRSSECGRRESRAPAAGTA